MICESKFGRLGFLKASFRIESIANINLSQKAFFYECRVDLCCVSEALAAVFLIFAALETGLNIDGFVWWIWIQNLLGGWAKSLGILGQSTAYQQMAEKLKAAPMIVEKRTVSQVRSRGAPTRGAGGSPARRGMCIQIHPSSLPQEGIAGLECLDEKSEAVMQIRIKFGWPASPTASMILRRTIGLLK